MTGTEAMVDTNVPVYAHNRASPFFEASRRLLKTLIDGGGFCATPVISLEFFSVVTNGRKVEAPFPPRRPTPPSKRCSIRESSTCWLPISTPHFSSG